MTIAEIVQVLESNDQEYMSEECMVFNRLLDAELVSLKRIQDAEEAWHEQLLKKAVGPDLTFDQLIVSKYRHWLEHAQRRLRQLDMQESAGSFPETAEEFRVRVEEVEDRLTMRARADMGMEARSKMLDDE